MVATMDQGFVDGIGGEAKSIVDEQALSKMKNVIVQNASNFAEVCKANLHRVTTHLMAKEQLQKVENLDLWSVSPKVKGISEACVALVNTNGVLKICHNGLDMIFPQIVSLAYENAVPNIPETSLQIGYFVKVVLGAFKDYYAYVTALICGDEIEINYFEKRNCYFVLCENDMDSHPVRDLQKADEKMMNSREHYSFN